MSFASSTVTEDFEDQENLNDLESLKQQSFVLVRFTTKKTIKYYVGEIKEVLPDNEFIISFLRRYKENKFVFPNVEDVSTVHINDIELHLPHPLNNGGTLRTAKCLSFNIDMDHYKVN